jgi:hypothetical protein
MTNDDRSIKGFQGDFGFGPTDHPEARPLPFRVLALGDFGAQAGPLPVDAHDLDAVMARLKPHLFYEVPNRLGGGRLEVDVRLASIKAFEPGAVARALPATAAVADFIDRAAGVQDGRLKPSEFKAELSAFAAVPALKGPLEDVLDKLGGAPPPPSTAAETSDDTGDSALDGIFNMVDTGKPAQPSGSGVSAFAASLGGSGGKGGPDLSGPIREAQGLLDAQLAEVMNHERFRQLEARWRGLRVFLRNARGVQVELLSDAEPLDAFHERVFPAELQGSSDAPLALILLDADVRNSPAELEALQQLGDSASQIQAPVVFAAGEAFLGTDMASLAALDAPGRLFEDGRFDKWRSLREKEPARWMCAALNGFVLRKPVAGGEWLYGSPVWLVGASVAGAMARSGWPASHTGAADGEIMGLPVREQNGAEHPLQALLSDRHLKDLSRAGFAPLMAQPNNDSAWVILAPTMRLPSKAEEEGKLGTLGYQLLAARAGELLVRAKGQIVVAGDVHASAERMGQFAAGMLEGTGGGAAAEINLEDETLVLRMRFGRDVLGGVEVVLGLRL